MSKRAVAVVLAMIAGLNVAGAQGVDKAPARLSPDARATEYDAWSRRNPDIAKRLKRAATEAGTLVAQHSADPSDMDAPPRSFPTQDTGMRFQECAMCPEMVVVPVGIFTMGSPASETGRAADEGPQQRVRIANAVAVSRFEVTRGEYEAFLAGTNRPISGNCITDRVQRGKWAPHPGTNFRDPGYAQTDSHPVACVSWNDAAAYVDWLNAQTRGGYRLPSEAEWEYVARAGSVTAYPWGASIDDGCADMNGTDSMARAKYPEKDILPEAAACSDGALNTAPVGSYRANAFGLYDMIGNVGEWTGDWSTTSYDGVTDDGKPLKGDSARRMVRGGSWGTYPRQLRSAERLRYVPTDLDDSIGIRVVRTLE